MADQPTSLPPSAGKAIGKSGTLIFNGIITGEEYNASLTRHSLLSKVEVMRRSSGTIREMLLVVKLPILSADWKMQAAQNPDGKVEELDQEISDFVQRELFGREINFFDFLREGLTDLDFGYSCFEKVHDLTEFNSQTRIGLSQLAFRKQKTIWAWQMDNGQPGVHQIVGDGSSADIPRSKLVIFVHDKEGENYDGISLLRYAYKDWDMLDKLTIVNAIALEKMSIGVPIISAKDGQTPSKEDLQRAEDTARNFRANEESFMNLPATMQVEMLDMKAGSTKEIIPTLNYHDSRIAKSILAGFMEIGGSSGSGSQALAKDLTSLFMKSEEATARSLQSTIMSDIIKPLVDMNYSNLPNGYPQLSFGSISDDDLSTTATSLGVLAEKGLITPDLDTESQLRKQWKLPALSDEARDMYKKKQEAAANGMDALANGGDGKEPEVDPNTGKPIQEPTGPTLEEKPPTKADPAKVKADALEELKKARTKYIAVTFED